ncbi:hypothetical protein SAMN05421507_101515 [Lentzea jiangxiensis]|uniref:Subtilisin inhibitor-like n=2 Tax=Lentzea jiangxiensis TaxID=641025 RepID=A0A1H0ETP0_9PSEU|nr:hypothetical protein SAMN05421507_101515 [Lentzea jiangxiensis]
MRTEAAVKFGLMRRFLLALGLVFGFVVFSAPAASAADNTRWQVEPCPAGTKALWLPRVDRVGTDLSCTTEEARSAAVEAAADSGSPTRVMNVVIAAAQQFADRSLTAESPCVLGAKGAVGEAIGTCVASR